MIGRPLRDDSLTLIKRSIVLSDYIARYSDDVKRTGSSNQYMALCPLHDNTKSKAMSIRDRPDGGVWKCFAGCGGGSVIDFWLILNGHDPEDRSKLGEAIDALAKENSIALPNRDKERESHKDVISPTRIKKALSKVANAAYDYLLSDKDDAALGAEYVAERQVPDSMADRYLLGMLPSDPDKAMKLILRASDDTEALLASTIIRKGDRREGFYTPMYGRLVVPILDKSRSIIGFGARVIPDVRCSNPDAKWINTSESSVYHKSEVLYGIDQGIKGKDVLVCEGYFDAWAISERADNTVGLAVCGTSLTQKHLDILRDAKSVTLLFDGDEAGSKALARVTWIANHMESVQYGLLDDGKDPYDLAIIEGDVDFRYKSGPLIEGAMEARFRTSETPEKFDRWVAETVGSLRSMKSKDEATAEAARLRGINKVAYTRSMSMAKIQRATKAEGAGSSAPTHDPKLLAVAGFILNAPDDYQVTYTSIFSDPDQLADAARFYLPGGVTDEGELVYLRLLSKKNVLTSQEADKADRALAECLDTDPRFVTRAVSGSIALLRQRGSDLIRQGGVPDHVANQILGLRDVLNLKDNHMSIMLMLEVTKAIMDISDSK